MIAWMGKRVVLATGIEYEMSVGAVGRERWRGSMICERETVL